MGEERVKIRAENYPANSWFGSDLHFFHENILKFEKDSRGRFSNADEMNEYFVSSWNSLVKPEDNVFYLGDVRFSTNRIEQRLNGIKHLILGNHDHTIIESDWDSVQFYKEIKIDGQLIVLMHYPIASWNRAEHGSIHLHGHMHGGPKNHQTGNTRPLVTKKARRMDVGYDATGSVLLSWKQIAERLISKL